MKRKIWKKWTAAAAAGLLAFSLSACGAAENRGQNNGEETTQQSSAGDGTQSDSKNGSEGSAAASAAEIQMPADGEYTPDVFWFSGGSGRVQITCDSVTVTDGQALAELVFSSDKYGYVKVDGETFDPVVGDGTTTFTVPVALNQETPIIGMTTAMSQPHEIEYTVYVYLEEAGGAPQPAPDTGGTAQTAGTAASSAGGGGNTDASQEGQKTGFRYTAAPQIEGLTFLEKTPLSYAECFEIYRYEGGYSLIDIPGSGTFFVVPEGGSVPAGLEADIVVLQQPLDRIYLAASSAMALFDAVDAVDHIRMSSLQQSGWYVDAAVDAMEDGKILFAGKYSEPDYEMLIAEGCDLAIESTMIYHTPKVKEMIEDLGIPVLVDRSSYETHPLGRTEWVRLYAALTGEEAAADDFFAEQAKVIEDLKDFENTGKTVAFFSINSDGSAVIRKPGDYIPKMIELAGGKYAFEDVKTDDSGTSFSVSMEEFYATAVDADYLIYNGSIDDPLTDIRDLLGKNELFADFKAVQEGNVWTTGKNFYQATDIVGQMITDVHLMLTGGDEEEMTFLTHVDG